MEDYRYKFEYGVFITTKNHIPDEIREGLANEIHKLLQMIISDEFDCTQIYKTGKKLIGFNTKSEVTYHQIIKGHEI